MADFCRDCSIQIFGRDYRDLAGITTEGNWKSDYAAWVLCEGCGPIQVDPNGNCVGGNCLINHLTGTRGEVRGMSKRIMVKFEGEKGCGKSRLKRIVWGGLSSCEGIILITSSDEHELQVEFKEKSQTNDWSEGYEAGVKAGRREGGS